MRTRKTVLLVMAALCGYVVAIGGVRHLAESSGGPLRALVDPLLTVSPFDAGLFMVGLIFMTWALLLGRAGQGFTRRTVLFAVALGSAMLTALFLFAALFGTPIHGSSEMTGVLALMSLIQGFIGVTAAFLMICRTECRASAPLPLILNGGLTMAAIAVVCIPMIRTGTGG